MNLLAVLLLSVAGDMPPADAPAPAVPAPVDSFALGQVLTHALSVCIDKADAVEIVEAAKVSREAAAKKWDEKDRCLNVPVSGPTVGRVVHTATDILHDGKRITLRVVEIISAGKVIGYFMTSWPVSAKLEITEPSKVVPNFRKERDL